MDTKTAIRNTLATGDMICMAYLNDLSDAELMQRPHPKCNHINFQVGHLISSEHEMMSKLGTMPALPAGFAEKYTKENADSNDPARFASKAELMATYKAQRDATLAILDQLPISAYADATGVHYAPTKGDMLLLQGCHWLMHAGQWVVVRRQNDKPVVI